MMLDLSITRAHTGTPTVSPTISMQHSRPAVRSTDSVRRYGDATDDEMDDMVGPDIVAVLGRGTVDGSQPFPGRVFAMMMSDQVVLSPPRFALAPPAPPPSAAESSSDLRAPRRALKAWVSRPELYSTPGARRGGTSPVFHRAAMSLLLVVVPGR